LKAAPIEKSIDQILTIWLDICFSWLYEYDGRFVGH
jgi:hypothetical protein